MMPPLRASAACGRPMALMAARHTPRCSAAEGAQLGGTSQPEGVCDRVESEALASRPWPPLSCCRVAGESSAAATAVSIGCARRVPPSRTEARSAPAFASFKSTGPSDGCSRTSCAAAAAAVMRTGSGAAVDVARRTRLVSVAAVPSTCAMLPSGAATEAAKTFSSALAA